MKAGLARIDRSVDDDFSRILPIFKSNEPGTERVAISEMETAILKASKLINIHSITKKPKRRKNRSDAYKKLASKEEYNNWIDDSYILMGEAYFYQKKYISAIENFTYVIRKFSEEDTKYEAYIWLIRCYTQMENYNEALELIQNIDASESFPKRLDREFALAVADFHMKLKEYEDAIPQLKTAIKNTFRKEDKIRYKYILAQLYKETGKFQLASETFEAVAGMNPPYIMEFNARINAAGAFTGIGDTDKLKKDLRRMLRDEKNVEFRDQIYFALGNIFVKEGNQPTAIDNYIKSAAASRENIFQRALSCLTLADIYFEEQNYKGAQSYYDSAMVVIDENYPNYQQISERYKSLTRLTDNLYTVEREDSLQRLASMSESERNNLIAGWIKDAREEELRAKQAESAEMMDRSFFRMNQARMGLGKQQRGSGWYFYNPTTVAYGKVEFQQTWGKRKLEDNWRRKNKNSASDTDLAEMEEEGQTALADSVPAGPKRVDDRQSREYYLQDVPMTEEQMKASHLRIRDALFNAGRIFKQDYNNYPLAIESYEDLLKRYDNNVYQLTTYFELWDLYKQVGNTERSNYYRNLIVNGYPESKYAKYLVNPNYFIELEARNDSLNNLYQQAFYNYQRGNYPAAGQLARQIRLMEPDSILLPKVAFIETIADGTQSNMEQFGNGLDSYIKTYPQSPVKPLAEDILKLIQDSTLVDYQKLVEMGYLNDEIKNDELLTAGEASQDEFGGKFSYDEDLLHYFVIAYPRESEVDLNRLKFDIANYNIDHYTKTDFDIETENLDSKTMLVVVRALADKEQSLIYFRSIIRKREVFETLNDVDYVNFVASSYNYREVLSDHNYVEYLKFFIKNYSRFIGGDFPEDELPEPEELMAKAMEEENQPEERGTFVVVKPEVKKDEFERDNEASQNFVIAVKDAGFDLRVLMSGFSSYNRSDFDDLNLSMQQRSVGSYKLLVIRPLSNIRQAMSYFRKVVMTRRLFKGLEDLSYRNFIITDTNLEKLIANGKMEEYMSFFRNYYIGGDFATDEPSTQPATGSDVAPVQQPKTAPVAEPEKPAYQGAFKTEVAGVHDFVLILPASGIDLDAVKSAVNSFNVQNYAALNLSVQQVQFDAQNVLLQVTSFGSKDIAMAYLRSIVRNQQVYGPLSEVNYRNFIISKENFPILLKNKDTKDYLEMYKNVYLTPSAR